MHLSDHLRGEHESDNQIHTKHHELGVGVTLKCLGGVHAHHDETDEGAGSHKHANPFLESEHATVLFVAVHTLYLKYSEG